MAQKQNLSVRGEKNHNIFPEPMIHVFILKFVAHNTAMKLFKVCDAILPSYTTILLSFEAFLEAVSLARGPF